MNSQKPNPFAVQTPEDVEAHHVVSLFVEEYTDFHKIPKIGHTFLNGSRGSGKSMIFRYLEPDCQSIVEKKSVHDLPFYAVYVAIKNTDLKLTELIRLEKKHASLILNEHFMTVYVASKIFSSLLKASIDTRNGTFTEAANAFYMNDFGPLLRRGGWTGDIPALETSTPLDGIFNAMMNVLDYIHLDTIAYLRKVAFEENAVNYRGPLFGYLDFLLPLIKRLKSRPFMPRGPVFLLIDDADNLNATQTMILNTWVSHRTGADVSLKIATQHGYKTYRTVMGQRIDSPHDYSEVNISDVYTSSKNKYRDRVRKIVEKRLEMHGFTETPEELFPEDEEQEKRIREIAESIRAKWEKEGRGNRPGDDALRYARPDFIRSLKGISKSGSTYSYAGFNQLVHVSSGIVRHFLEAASHMYGEECSKVGGKSVTSISPGVQTKVVRQLADEFLFNEFEKITKDEHEEEAHLDKLKKLRNLIVALGGMFSAILLSDASERRVFSIAFSDEPDDEIRDVLELGIRYGYFHRSSIGNKEGTGRTSLYIFSRRLSPYFTLDPTGFAGYKFMLSGRVREAMHSPKKFLSNLKSYGIDDYLESPQGVLFEEG